METIFSHIVQKRFSRENEDVAKERSEELDGCYIYQSNIILTPFFDYRFMPQSRIDILGQRLRLLFAR